MPDLFILVLENDRWELQPVRETEFPRLFETDSTDHLMMEWLAEARSC